MANRRITKEMAHKAALDMYDAVYGEQLKAARSKLNKALEEFVKRYFPAPVLACVKEYEKFYKVTKSIELYVYSKKNKDGNFEGSYEIIRGLISFIVPMQQTNWNCFCSIEALEKDCKNIVAAHNADKELDRKALTFRNSVEDTLIALRTEKKVAENLPEALPYIKFPDDKSNLPAPVFSEIRNLLQGIEKKQ